MSLKNITIVFTGFRDKDLESFIIKLGGNVKTSVSNQTDIVVYDGKGENSEKKRKAEELGKTIIKKDIFLLKYFSKKTLKNISKEPKKSTKSDKKTSKKIIKQLEPNELKSSVIPLYDKEDIIKTKKEYLIHDNGSRPFLVEVDNKTFSVKKQSIDSDDAPYDNIVIKPTKYERIFIGKCPNYGRKFDGNSVLVHLHGKDYMVIGKTIFKLHLNDYIIGYKSPVGNSDLPYPYAYGEKNTYLLIEDTYIPNELLKEKDPYNQFYGWDTQLTIQQRNKLHKEHFSKYNVLKQKKMIHDRIQ
jgi:hypothetical protein